MAVAEKYDIQSEVIPGIATGFCGGMARTAGLCGALTGGIMALGLLFGRRSPQDPQYKIYALTERLVHDFEKEFGSRNCSDLLGCDISTPQGEADFMRANLGKTRCLDITVKTTQLLMQVIEKQDDIRHSLLKA